MAEASYFALMMQARRLKNGVRRSASTGQEPLRPAFAATMTPQLSPSCCLLQGTRTNENSGPECASPDRRRGTPARPPARRRAGPVHSG